ncbi:MAG: MogA/MoaB family molybdenum cofactor biosynthesis protein [Desulfovibrionaceae bacterium]|nr:MogA/MoaB family molybdenum cofactor biosynthesis protein [Desulfovibrionaceae bacterium]
MNTLYTPHVSKGEYIYFTDDSNDPCYMPAGAITSLRVGTILCNSHGEESLLVIGKQYHYTHETRAFHRLICEALCDISEANEQYSIHHKGYSVAWITLSDSASVGKRSDTSGPRIGSLLRASFDISVERSFVIPDEPEQLEHLLLDLSLFQRFNCILTTGGTGLSPRDITPNVMEKIIQHPLHGFEIAMMQASMQYVSTAILSRARAGIIAQSIIINLPGSPKAVEQNLIPLLPALPHAMDKLCGDTSDCAGLFTLPSTK